METCIQNKLSLPENYNLEFLFRDAEGTNYLIARDITRERQLDQEMDELGLTFKRKTRNTIMRIRCFAYGLMERTDPATASHDKKLDELIKRKIHASNHPQYDLFIGKEKMTLARTSNITKNNGTTIEFVYDGQKGTIHLNELVIDYKGERLELEKITTSLKSA
jgi:hypothetical protein